VACTDRNGFPRLIFHGVSQHTVAATICGQRGTWRRIVSTAQSAITDLNPHCPADTTDSLPMNAARCLTLAAIFGFLGVALGAFGAHGLNDTKYLENRYADLPAKNVAGQTFPARNRSRIPPDSHRGPAGCGAAAAASAIATAADGCVVLHRWDPAVFRIPVHPCHLRPQGRRHPLGRRRAHRRHAAADRLADTGSSDLPPAQQQSRNLRDSAAHG